MINRYTQSTRIHETDGTMRKMLSLGLMISMILISVLESKGQEGAGLVELHAEALAGGVALTFPAGSEWSFGLDLSAGKHFGLDLLEVDDELDLVALGYPVICWRPDPGVQVSLSPIGFAAVIGNDFGAIYPSGRLGVGHFRGRFGLGTELRLVRIAGSFGTGDYWLHWSPVRVSVRI